MIRAMFASVSALRNHQNALDVVGNNLANVNTNGFKSGRANFRDALYETLSSSAAPVVGGLGGINPIQIGLGMRLGGIDYIQTQGSLQNTGRTTDLAIQGNGFFVMSDGTSTRYTRSGGFDLDANGQIVDTATGYKVMDTAGAAITIDSATYSSFSITNGGVVTGVTPAGVSVVLGTIALVTFPNPAGLTHTGNNMYETSPASGAASALGAPLAGSRGELAIGALEMSNVDIAQQMSSMIINQRGFQANSRVISTMDEVFQDLIQLKR